MSVLISLLIIIAVSALLYAFLGWLAKALDRMEREYRRKNFDSWRDRE